MINCIICGIRVEQEEGIVLYGDPDFTQPLYKICGQKCYDQMLLEREFHEEKVKCLISV